MKRLLCLLFLAAAFGSSALADKPRTGFIREADTVTLDTNGSRLVFTNARRDASRLNSKAQIMKHHLQRLACGLALVLLLAAPPASTAASPHSGIIGRTFIYRGPAFPGPAVPAVVTSFPVAATFTVLSSRTGRVVAQVTSAANGDFSLALHPGRYIIVPADLPDSSFCSFATPEPFEVTVRAREFSGAGFTYIAGCSPGVVGIP